MKPPVNEVDAVPPQRDQLRRAQAVTVGKQDQGGVAVAVAIGAGGGDQLLDLSLGQVFARPELGVRPAARR